jgi:putative oxidoreductase
MKMEAISPMVALSPRLPSPVPHTRPTVLCRRWYGMPPKPLDGRSNVKVATVILRSLMGLLFLFASVTYFGKLITPPPPTGAMKVFSEGLEASVYLLPTVKVIELICGVAFLSGRFVALAAVLIAPIIVNIVLIQGFLDPKGLPVALFLVVANGMVAYANWDRYQALFKA